MRKKKLMQKVDQWVLDIPIVQDFIQIGEERGMENQLKQERQTLLTIVQLRFPDLVDIARQLLEGIHESAVLQQLFIKMSLATSSQDAEQALVGSYKKDNKQH